MHPHIQKTIYCALSCALTLSLCTPALASFALGEDLSQVDTTLHTDTQLSQSVFWSTSYSDLRTEQVVTYSPSDDVQPVVTYGGVLTNRQTVSAAASELEADGYRVVAGINGDYYNLTNGLPVGLVISDGEVISSDGTFSAIGFYEDGSAIIGKPSMSMSVDLGYARTDEAGYSTQVVRRLDGVNRARSSTSGIYFYTYDFNDRHTTGTTEAGVNVLCTLDDDVVLNAPITMTVDAISEGTGAITMAENQVVLSVNANATAYETDALRDCQVGSTITMTLTADEAWSDVVTAMGALYSLVEDGAVASGLTTDIGPRTAVGQKANGDLVFYTIDGRSSGYSIGATMTQVAQRLIELGCVSAVGLDGGGSTTMAVSGPFDETISVINQPSDGSERSVSTHLFLVSDLGATGRLSALAVEPSARYVVAGSEVQCNVTGIDTNYYPMDTSYDLDASAGSIVEDTLYTPHYDATVTITATKGSKSGETTVYVVESPDTLGIYADTIALSSLTIAPGESTHLEAHAWDNYLELYGDATAFTWVLDGDIGILDAAGQFVATNAGTGSITVSAGDTAVTIPVSVTKLALQTVEDFEGDTTFAHNTSGMTYSVNTNIQQVALGRNSGTFTYDVNSNGSASISASYSVPSAYSQLNLWVCGDDSANTLYLETNQGSVEITQLGFADWQVFEVALPAGTTSITGLSILASGELSIDELGDEYTLYLTPSGTIGVDQMVLSYGGLVDEEAPVITGDLSLTQDVSIIENESEDTAELETTQTTRTATLSVSVVDDVDGFVSAQDVTVYLDGTEAAYAYNVNTGVLTASFTFTDEAAHRITAEVVDASGNRERKSWDVDAISTTPVFADTTDHWAGTYVDFLKTAGVTNGYADNTFRPDQNISRQEFAVMLYRYLDIDATLYAYVSLPFADLGQIGDYALDAVKALYTMGIINGSTGSDGQLYFSPNDSLTRAQASAMIGRTQAKGFPVADLTFADATSIPSYATDYVATMVHLGILGGYTDNTFRPNVNITRGQMAKILYNSL